MTMRAQLASDIDADEVLVELLAEGEQWAEVAWSKETGRLELRLYPTPGAEVQHFDLQDVMDILVEAAERLGAPEQPNGS